MPLATPVPFLSMTNQNVFFWEKLYGRTQRCAVSFSTDAQAADFTLHLERNASLLSTDPVSPSVFARENLSGKPEHFDWLLSPNNFPPRSPPFSPRPWLAHVLWMLSGKGFTRSLVHSSLGACTLNIHTLQRFVPLGNPSEDLCYIISYVCCFLMLLDLEVFCVFYTDQPCHIIKL